MTREDIIILSGYILAIALLLVGLILIGKKVDAFSCSKYGEAAERETKYDNWAGCLVKTQSGWRRLEEQRTIDRDDGQ